MSKKNKNVKKDETPEEYFVGMLLTASQNDLNKIELVDVWRKKKNKVDLYYRVNNFDEPFDIKKEQRVPFRFYDYYDKFIEKAKEILEERGISVPVIKIRCKDIE